jgi:hypothetical protein
MTYKELCDKIMAIIPTASFGEDNDGQIIIYTNMKGNNTLVDMDVHNEYLESCGLLPNHEGPCGILETCNQPRDHDGPCGIISRKIQETNGKKEITERDRE